MRRLKSGEFLLERSLYEWLLPTWNYIQTFRFHDGETIFEAEREFQEPMAPIFEKLQSGKPLTAGEVRKIVRWRGPMGTKVGGPDRGQIWDKFIRQFVEMGLSEKTVRER